MTKQSAKDTLLLFFNAGKPAEKINVVKSTITTRQTPF